MFGAQMSKHGCDLAADKQAKMVGAESTTSASCSWNGAVYRLHEALKTKAVGGCVVMCVRTEETGTFVPVTHEPRILHYIRKSGVLCIRRTWCEIWEAKHDTQ
jgi:hypothetical protein